MKDELYETDIIYKELVDNYVRASIKLDKARITRKDRIDNLTIEELSNNLTKSLNALARYRDYLRHKDLVKFIKIIDFTVEDLAVMFEKRIIPAKILSDMIKFKVSDK